MDEQPDKTARRQITTYRVAMACVFLAAFAVDFALSFPSALLLHFAFRASWSAAVFLLASAIYGGIATTFQLKNMSSLSRFRGKLNSDSSQKEGGVALSKVVLPILSVNLLAAETGLAGIVYKIDHVWGIFLAGLFLYITVRFILKLIRKGFFTRMQEKDREIPCC